MDVLENAAAPPRDGPAPEAKQEAWMIPVV